MKCFNICWGILRNLLAKHRLLGNFEKFLKISDENSIKILNFIIIFGKIVTKNRALGNNTIFLQQFFRLRGERVKWRRVKWNIIFWNYRKIPPAACGWLRNCWQIVFRSVSSLMRNSFSCITENTSMENQKRASIEKFYRQGIFRSWHGEFL